MGDRGWNPRIPAPTRMAGEEFFEVRFMRYREDWEKSKARQAAFWNGEILDRCCVSITAPRDGAGSAPSFTRDEAYYTDPQAVIAANRAQMERTYYAGDAFPCMPLDLGAGGHAGFFKGERHYIRDTVWFFPSLKHPDDLEFDETSPLYQKTLELARAFAQDSRGRLLYFHARFHRQCRRPLPSDGPGRPDDRHAGGAPGRAPGASKDSGSL